MPTMETVSRAVVVVIGDTSGARRGGRCREGHRARRGLRRRRALVVVTELAGIDEAVASQVVSYLAAGYCELGALPTTDRFVIERFFDDTGGMQLVVHSPRRAPVPTAPLGLALRKRFCRTFDFEPAGGRERRRRRALARAPAFLPAGGGARLPLAGDGSDTLVQAVLPTPMFGSRWRWNLSRSLIAPRYRGSRHVPPAVQRMRRPTT